MRKVQAVFDIGKTNKKFFLFDDNYQEVIKDYTSFEEIKDEDGVACDDLPAIQKWLKTTFDQYLVDPAFEIRALNFSSYGASFVHIDQDGEIVTPLYNYLKPYPADILASFYKKYGGEMAFAQQTASPPLGMLNSGLQLYWLKYAKPELFERIRWSMHLPQYLSFLFTGIPLSEYSSIGCHTGLWDFVKNDYHAWVYAEGIDRILPPIVDTTTSINATYKGQKLTIGVGIHDSSSALLPYLLADKKPFLLLSTGTWSIALNPFNHEPLSSEDLHNDCLNFMRIDGLPVKASRLFLGNEYSLQLKKMHAHFDKAYGYHRNIAFDQALYQELTADYKHCFKLESIAIDRAQPEATQLSAFDSFEKAYHQLLIELVELQIEAAQRAIGNTLIHKIYIDGGFADNAIYVELLSAHFHDKKMRITQSPLGSALGAAMVIANKKVGKKFLKKHYALTKYTSLI